MMAAAFRSIGVDAAPTPDSDHETLELGGLHASGEECLPHKITLGDFLRVCRQPRSDPEKTAFFMPRAPGPCRFGQYAPYLRRVLDEQGLGDVLIVSPDSGENYNELGGHDSDLMRTAWMGIVAGDLATRFLLKTRPYELHNGDTDTVFQESIQQLEDMAARQDLSPQDKVHALAGVVTLIRERFRAVPARYTKGRPLIGLVGEIFCRLNTFSNDDVARRIEQLGGECWLSDMSEWVWYTNWCRETDCIRDKGRFNGQFLKLKLKTHTQHKYEKNPANPGHGGFQGLRGTARCP